MGGLPFLDDFLCRNIGDYRLALMRDGLAIVSPVSLQGQHYTDREKDCQPCVCNGILRSLWGVRGEHAEEAPDYGDPTCEGH